MQSQPISVYGKGIENFCAKRKPYICPYGCMVLFCTKTEWENATLFSKTVNTKIFWKKIKGNSNNGRI